MKKKTIKGVDRYLFDDIFEFSTYHLGIQPLEWEDPTVKPLDWIKTSEGGVTQCLTVVMLSDKRVIGTIMGKFMVGESIMDNTVRDNHSNLVPKDGKEKGYFEKGLPDRIERMARLMALGEDRIEAFKKTHPDAKSEVYIKQKVSTITNNKHFKDYMSNEFTKLLEKKEMDTTWCLDNLKKIVEDPKAPAVVKKSVIDDVLTFHGEGKEQKQLETHSFQISHQIGEGELKDIRALKEVKKTEAPIEKDG